MKNKLLYGIVSLSIVIVTVLVSVYLINAKPKPKKDNEKYNSMSVETEKVQYKEIVSNMNYRGRLTAFDNISLSSEVQGRIMKGDVRFKAGEKFTKNQVIVRIYDEDTKAVLKSGKSNLLQIISKILPDLKVDYSNEYKKWLKFFKDIDVDKKLPELPSINSNKEKVFLAANNVLTNYYSLQQQEINLQKYTIKAPFTGSFKTVNKEIGAVASPGVELASLIRSDKLEVTVPVLPADLKWINKDDKVKITNSKGESKMANVSRISGFVEESSQSVNVYLDFYADVQSGGFLHGEYLDVFFNGIKINGFEIPREAMLDGNYVYELKNNMLKKLKVDILRQLNDSYIISGIDTNKIIVMESLAEVDSNVKYTAR